LNIVEKLKGGSKAGASEEIESQWGFLKNIINIDKFFDSGTEPGSKSSRTVPPAKSAESAGKGKKTDSAGPAAKEESAQDPKKEKDESTNETKEKTKDEAAGPPD